MAYQPQIIVIGAGIVGLSTAYALLKEGLYNVRVLEQGAVNYHRSTSSSISRLLRFEYGADALYARMVKLSLERWHELELSTRRSLYTPTGLLSFGRAGEDTLREYEIMRGLGLASEWLSAQHCLQRFPQFDIKNYDFLTYNTAGGILHASTCLEALKQAILDLGGEIIEGCHVAQIQHDQTRRPPRVILASGDEMHADRLVVAAGPWVHNLLGSLHMPIEVTRQYILYFSGLPTSVFGAGAFPSFTEKNLYGFPIHKGSHGWLKATSHAFGQPIDPDAPVQIEEQAVTRIAQELYALLPALRGATLAHVEACMYDVSPDEDFILDYLPGDTRVVFATGLSGHGFKFGPLLGHLLSSMITEKPPEVPLGRFRLARLPRQQARQIISVA